MQSKKQEKAKLPKEPIILDHIDGISVDADRHINSLNVLRSLLLGMHYLAEITRRQEVSFLENQHGNTRTKSLMEITDNTLMLGCMCDWFAISLVSYLRHVKLLDLMEVNEWEIADLSDNEVRKEVKRVCPLYIRSVVPVVYKWRNKIAAHRAATDPRDSDSLTTLTYSTMPTVTYDRPYYRVGGLRLYIRDGSLPVVHEKAYRQLPPIRRHQLNIAKAKRNDGLLAVEPWSLTETFEDLAPRFWTEVNITPLPDY